jgi:hypothetical protein
VVQETVGVGKQALRLCLQHWEKAVILAVLLTLVILVSVKVGEGVKGLHRFLL